MTTAATAYPDSLCPFCGRSTRVCDGRLCNRIKLDFNMVVCVRKGGWRSAPTYTFLDRDNNVVTFNKR